MTTITERAREALEHATKGPWGAALERGCHGVIAASLPEGAANFVGIVGNSLGTPEKEPARFANAKLMALAPDLARIAIAAEALAKAMEAGEDTDTALAELQSALAGEEDK